MYFLFKLQTNRTTLPAMAGKFFDFHSECHANQVLIRVNVHRHTFLTEFYEILRKKESQSL